MTPRPPIIVGAGLAGLIAGHAWPQALILEQSPAPTQTHKALLRFRSEAVSQLTGIEFRRVLVRKGIWSGGRFVDPSIRLANQYAQKCIGVLAADRSIWNVAPVERFIAPEDFHEQLLVGTRERIEFGVDAFAPGQRADSGPLISTAPLPLTAAALKVLPAGHEFLRAPISVRRFDLGAKCDLYQTVYFPDPDVSVYRASITGRTLIVELAGRETAPLDRPEGYADVLSAFGLTNISWESSGAVKQQYGKIAHVNDDMRRRLLFTLTHDFDIYSLGRFATWRNILLDDVVQDIAVVKRLMKGGSYELRHAAGSSAKG